VLSLGFSHASQDGTEIDIYFSKRYSGGTAAGNYKMAFNEDSSASGHDEPWIQWYVRAEVLR
jgi:hypothetical protein